jgi:hypothetical protein
MRVRILGQEIEVEEGIDILNLNELKRISKLEYCGHGHYERSLYISDLLDNISKLSIKEKLEDVEGGTYENN